MTKSRLAALLLAPAITRRSPPGNGSGLNSTAFTSVKTVVLAPMPREIVRIIAAENHGCCPIMRQA